MPVKDNVPASPLSYADAGVSIAAGNALVEAIKPAARRTFRPEVMGSLGGFGALFDLKKSGYRDPVLVSGTDGVGTKLKIAQHLDRHATIGIDLVAMCVNDLVVQGAEPLFFLDYFACGSLSVPQAASVIEGIAEGCIRAGCALIGGETAEMPGMYGAGEYDLAGFAVGAVERDGILPRQGDMREGDVLLGLASSGFHSNGYSLVRRVIERAGIAYDAPLPAELSDPRRTIGDLLLEPTRIYVKPCLAAIRQSTGIKALAHITGGGLTENLPRVLPDGLAAEIDLSAWFMPPVFAWIRSLGAIAESEMLRAFNCGIGMVLAVAADHAKAVVTQLECEGETVVTIGRLIAASGHERVTYRGALA